MNHWSKTTTCCAQFERRLTNSLEPYRVALSMDAAVPISCGLNECYYLWSYLNTGISSICLYDATCVSKMLYNCNSWASPKKFLDKLDACHCRHLYTITGHRWPDSVISNKMCNVVPLSVIVNQQRWSIFSHVLRMPENKPAQQALEFALLGSSKYISSTACHYSNLLNLLRADLKRSKLWYTQIERGTAGT